MRKWINNYFSFTKSEFNGLLALFFLIVMIAILPRLYRMLWPDTMPKAEMAEIVKLDLETKFKNPAPGRKDQVNNVRKKIIRLRVFDPNTLNQQGWEELGLSAKQAQAVRNYVAKGGKFYKAEDLKKMYTITPETYVKIAPFVQVNAPAVARRFSRYPTVLQAKRPLAVYELNALDTTAMQVINGIGPAFARRIFKYRERLGGFHDTKQLLEVFGIDSVKYKEIESQVRVEAAAIKKIKINTVEFDGLRQHPYLTYKQVNAIIEYRKQHGNYSSFADLKKVAILPAETVERLAPYLSF